MTLVDSDRWAYFERLEKKRLFLETLKECGNVVHSAAAAGFYPQTAYVWRKKDEEFAAAWDIAAASAETRPGTYGLEAQLRLGRLIVKDRENGLPWKVIAYQRGLGVTRCWMLWRSAKLHDDDIHEYRED